MNRRWLIALLVALPLTLSSCSKKPDAPPIPEAPPELTADSLSIMDLVPYCENEDERWILTNGSHATSLYMADDIIARMGKKGLPFIDYFLFNGGVEEAFKHEADAHPSYVRISKDVFAMDIAKADIAGSERALRSHFYPDLNDSEIRDMGSITQVLHTVRLLRKGGSPFEPTERMIFYASDNSCHVTLRLSGGSVGLKQFHDNGISFWVPWDTAHGALVSDLVGASFNTEVEILYKDVNAATTNRVLITTYRMPQPGHVLYPTPRDPSSITNPPNFDATEKGYAVAEIKSVASNLNQKISVAWGAEKIAYSLDVELSPSNEVCTIVRYKTPDNAKERTYMEGNIMHHLYLAYSGIMKTVGELRGVSRHDIPYETWISTKVIVYGSGLELVDGNSNVHIPSLDQIGLLRHQEWMKNRVQ